jgi:hypothetical protein
MKELVEDDLLGYEPVEQVLYARIERSGSVRLGDRYRVPKTYIRSGIGEVTNIDGVNVTKGGGSVDSYWLIDLKATVAEPEDPCDSGFMEEISS